MYLNLKDSATQKVYVTSDTHFGHQRDFVWKSRGHESYEDHDKNLIDTINSLVRPNDILLHLGDFCLNTPIEKYNDILTNINCQNIYTLWGNHNNPHEKRVYIPGQPKQMVRNIPVMTYPYEYRNVVFLPHYVELVWNGQFIVMEHYPLLVWNEMMHGAWMLCGHSHYGCPQTVASNPNGKILDVGWDGHKKPLTFEEVSAIMSTKQFVVIDDHHK